MNKDRDETQNLIDFAGKIGKVEQGLEEIRIHLTNHVSQHKFDKIVQVIYFGLTIAMFCILRWG